MTERDGKAYGERMPTPTSSAGRRAALLSLLLVFACGSVAGRVPAESRTPSDRPLTSAATIAPSHEPPAASTTTAGNDPEPWLADDPNDGEDMCQGDMSAGFDVSSNKPAFFCTACQGSSACGIVASRRADAYWSLQAQLCQSGRHMTRRAYNRGFQCHACRVQSPADDLPVCPSR
jgi:hypothetical protein